MPYTKGELVEQVLLRISGGKPTNELDIRREDVDKYLSAAINYITIQQYWQTRGAEGYSEVQDDFIGQYILPIKYDSARDLKYVDKPPIVALPRNRGIRAIMPLQGDVQYIPTTASARMHDMYYAKHIGGIPRYWVEQDKIYFLNQPLEEGDEVVVLGVTSASDLNDDDVLPIPAGYEAQVIDLMVQFFTGQRTLPSDNQSNNIDDINTVQR